MNAKSLQFAAITWVIFTFLFSGLHPVKAMGSHYLSVDLRTDMTEIVLASDYRVQIAAFVLPNGAFPSYTAGWLAINPYSKRSSPIQVGLMADQGGLYWFVHSADLTTCLQGTPLWEDQEQTRLNGCKGDPYQFVELSTFHTVELVSYIPGEWIARIYSSGDMGYDLAVVNVDDKDAIPNSSSVIYDADVNFTETFEQAEDPMLESGFRFFRPQYKSQVDQVGFADWPASTASTRQGQNKLYAYSTVGQDFCSEVYGAKLFMGHARSWYFGSPITGTSMICDGSLFNEAFIPSVMR